MIPKTKQEYKNILQNLRREKRVLRKKLEEKISDYNFLTHGLSEEIKDIKRQLSLFKTQERIA
jgi:predicted nuclease with TOPRIM domain